MFEVQEPSQKLLEKWRGSYDETAVLPSWLSAHQWNYGVDVALATARDVRHKLLLKPTDRVLEIGSGSGAFLAAVLHDAQPGIGFDFSVAQVKGSDKFGVDKNKIKLGVAEASHLPVPSDSFDKVLCYSVVHYFPDDRYFRSAVKEMLRVCRADGVLLLGDVAGVMERSRKSMVGLGVPAVLADLVLWALLPLRHLYWAVKERRPREGRFFRRSYLRKFLRSLNCECEILDQEIPGRPASRCRFDIRIRKNRA